MAKVVVTIKRDGTAKVEGEGFETAALKRDLRSMGNVEEEHVGHEHVSNTTGETQHQSH